MGTEMHLAMAGSSRLAKETQRVRIRRHILARPRLIPLGFGLFAAGCVVGAGIMTLPIHGGRFPFWLHGSVIALTTGAGVFTMARWLVRELRHQQWAEEALRHANEALEERVRQRTAELAAANEALHDKIREIRRTEEALVRSEKLAATGRLAATIAHEINNPLAAMTNLVYLLGSLVTDSTARDYVHLIDKQLRTISRIASQTLKFNRGSGRPAEVSLTELIEDVLAFYQPEADRHGVTLSKRIDVAGTVIGFSGEIRQVLSNLVLNAIEATPKGRVTLHLNAATNWRNPSSRGYRIWVSDNGAGVDPAHRARVFEPFFTTKGEKGTGLGLWVSLGIINRAGGSIRLWSNCRPGRSGSCFSIFLPAVVAVVEMPQRRRYEASEPPAEISSPSSNPSRSC
jgi:signal transduction histidine kinase